MPGLKKRFPPKNVFCRTCRAGELEINDGLLVRRAIMLRPIMAGEQDNAQEMENLSKAVRMIAPKEGTTTSVFFGELVHKRDVILKLVCRRRTPWKLDRWTERHQRQEVEVENKVASRNKSKQGGCTARCMCLQEVARAFSRAAENEKRETLANRGTTSFQGGCADHAIRKTS